MLWYGKWVMDKDEAEEKVLTVDDGAPAIAQECWIFEDQIDHHDANGNFLFTEGKLIKGTFEELIVPPSVITIEDRAFYRHAGLRKISTLVNVVTIGKEAFKGCDQLSYVVAPKARLASVADPETKQKLTLGYLLHKEQYESSIAQEYETYAMKQKAALLKLAHKHGLTAAAAALAPPKAARPTVTKAPTKLSAEEATLLLERTVLSGSAEEIAAVIAAHQPFAMTARALGFACRCRSTEIVRLLLKEKANFSFKDKNQITKFGLAYKPSGREFITKFLPADGSG